MADATVADYMVRNVVYVEPQMTVKEVTEKMINSNFYGFPIAERGYLLGFVTSKELLRFTDRPNATMREVMKRGTVCVIPSMKISDAIRVLFRYGIRNLPVVDENKKLVGIISNIDIVRSQIERSRPSKVMSVKNFIESQNGLRIRIVNMNVPMNQILPSQKEVYMDELIGRQFEIKRGLYEPLIVIKRRGGYLIVDGHHRAMAAMKLGLESFKAIVLEPNDLDVKLGLERTAEKWGLRSLNDVKIIEGSKHPFIEVTTMLLPDEELEAINKRLQDSK
ncbi:MAG: CBS domain-containing protein [Candidatus Methanomethylophilaceae archaeon]|nr:CBS domain-containing protein [Candidatus Methanomethylophilaceae archaeon]